jgi:hypothetical protein
VVAIVAASYLLQTTYVAEQAAEMERLETALREIRWVNNDLLLDIAQHQEMARIESEAVRLGLGPARQFEYVEVLVDAPASSIGEGAAKGWLAGDAVSKHLPDWLSQLLGQFMAWASGPVVPASPVSE